MTKTYISPGARRILTRDADASSGPMGSLRSLAEQAGLAPDEQFLGIWPGENYRLARTPAGDTVLVGTDAERAGQNALTGPGAAFGTTSPAKGLRARASDTARQGRVARRNVGAVQAANERARERMGASWTGGESEAGMTQLPTRNADPTKDGVRR